MDRQHFYNARRQIPNRKEAEKILLEKVLPFLQGRKNTALYIPVRSEADLWQFLKDRPGICVPKVLNETTMAFYRPKGLMKGSWGILEPAAGQEVIPEVMIVPVVGYQGCHRLGNGKGYYDRYIAAHPEIETIGIAFDQQEGDFEIHPWDAELDYMITPEKIFRKEQK